MSSKLKSVLVGLEILMLIVILYLGFTTQAKLNLLALQQEKIEEQISVLMPLVNKSSVEDFNALSAKRIIYTLNAIEKFVRTTPLVECGNWNNGQRKEKAIRTENR